MFVCMRICMCVYVCVYMSVLCMFVRKYIYVCMRVRVYVGTSMYLCVYACMHACMYVYASIPYVCFLNVYIHFVYVVLCSCTPAYIYTFRVCSCVFLYQCLSIWRDRLIGFAYTHTHTHTHAHIHTRTHALPSVTCCGHLRCSALATS